MLLSGIQLPPDACGYWAHILSQCSLLRVCLKIPGPIFSPFSALPTHLWASVSSQFFYPLSCSWQEGESSGYTCPQWCHMSIPDQSLYQWEYEALIGSGMGHMIHLRFSGREQIEDYELELRGMWFLQEKPWAGAGANAEDASLPQSLTHKQKNEIGQEGTECNALCLLCWLLYCLLIFYTIIINSWLLPDQILISFFAYALPSTCYCLYWKAFAEMMETMKRSVGQWWGGGNE